MTRFAGSFSDEDVPLSGAGPVLNRFWRILNLYWVCTYRRGSDTAAKPWSWRFSVTEPPPVPNEAMAWRHPTYEEALARQHLFDTSRANWDLYVVRDADERFRKRGFDPRRLAQAEAVAYLQRRGVEVK